MRNNLWVHTDLKAQNVTVMVDGEHLLEVPLDEVSSEVEALIEALAICAEKQEHDLRERAYSVGEAGYYR